MRRWLIRGVVGALAIVLLVGAAAAGYFWHLGADLITRGKAAGWTVEASSAPLSVFEQTLAKAMFADSWNRSGFPCRTIAEAGPGNSHSMRISAEVARDILMDTNPERTVAASFARVSAACQLEMAHSDTELLRLWLNHLRRADHEGADAIARGLFGKSLPELDEVESARMAALIHSPRAWKQPEHWTERADYMLAQAQQYTWAGDRLERGSEHAK